ncbi:hypothetical protein Q2T40_17445 [Winogradskyella maritima]|uniref:CcmD family protein n=1 Tax=Winogradskyella maritima TaxID=1517766 RepID=A0ABV8AFG7_9FLAO|nr:hypothetical protein [Winogradskyella maritima]
MKIFTLILTIAAVGIIAFNATKLNTEVLLEGDSLVAVITIVAALCVIMMLQILRISKKIETLSKKR